MSNPHGSTSGYPAHPSPPSGSGHSSQPQQQQQQQPSSEDGHSRRHPERRRADAVPKTQAGRPPISSQSKQPPSSSASSSKSPLISSFATAAPKDQQPCAQLSKDKSACRDHRMDDAVGATKSAYVAQDRKITSRSDPTERLLMTGEEMVGTRPKRPRGSSQTHMEVDITSSDHHTRAPRPNGAYRDTMRSEVHSHHQEMLTDEEESDEPKRGETIAEIHFYREDTPPSIAGLGLPTSDQQAGDYTSVSATVIRKHSMKGPPPVTPDQAAVDRISESPSVESKTLLQEGGQKLPSVQDNAEFDKMVTQEDSDMRSVEELEEIKPAKPTLSSDPKNTLLQQCAYEKSDSKTQQGELTQVKILKEEEDSKSASSKSIKATEREKGTPQNEMMEFCKLTPGILPLEEDWESIHDPNQPLEERLTATVIRRHVKSKTGASAPSGGKKQQLDSKMETTPTDAPRADPVQTESTTAVRSPTKDKTLSPTQEKLPVKNGGVYTGQSKTTLVSDVAVDTSLTCDQNGNGIQSAPKSDFKPGKDSTQIICKAEIITCDGSTDLGNAVKKSAKTHVGVKGVVVTMPDDVIEPLNDRNSTKIESALQGSARPTKKEMSVVHQYNAGSKSPSPGKRVSIREPPETVVLDDSDISAQKTSKSSASRTPPSTKDIETMESNRQQSAGDVEAENGTWVDEGRDAGTKPEVNGRANPRNSKSCCFCWCCCCSCSCLRCYRIASLSVNNNNVQGSGDSNKSQPQQGNMDHFFNGDGEPQPTLEDIRNWGESFDKLMKCGAGRKVFREFLQCEYSEENILFWLACEDLKKETNPDAVKEKASLIYEDFISVLSPREVSLDSRVRDIINKNMVNPTPNTFDEAQLQIYTLMHRDSYPRFVNSPIYRKLAQLPVPSRKGSTA